MKKRRAKSVIRIIVISLILCWGITVFVDYSLCKQIKQPIFSVRMNVSDTNIYWGLGYRIEIRYEGFMGFAGEQLKGYFYWFWQ